MVHILLKRKMIGVIATVYSVEQGREVGRLMKLQYFESDSGQFETNSVTDGKPVQIRKNRRGVTEPRFLGNNSSKCILYKL